MTSVSSIKSVRTKYRNTLDKEITNSKVIVASDLDKISKNVCLQGANMCLGLLKTYCPKLELQMNKFTNAVRESDPGLADEVVDLDCQLILDAEKSCIELTQFIDSVQRKNETPTDSKLVKQESESEKVQDKLQKLMMSQLEQQREFFERQEQNEKKAFCSVKLPKLDLIPFSGDKMKWTSFWDAFECTIHQNGKLSGIDKFNYLLSKLHGEARRAVNGLALSNENYAIAIGILKERFGNEQEAVDMHYNQLMHIPPVNNKQESLRSFLDSIEKHLRSLEVLKENVNQQIFVSLIRSKLPQDVLRQLEIMKGPSKVWTVVSLRNHLSAYVLACEHSQVNPKDEVQTKRLQPVNKQYSYRSNPRTNYSEDSGRKQTYSTESLLVSQKQNPKQQSVKRDQCRYCEKNHYSDECPKYRTVDERKKLIKGSCYRCLRNNHTDKDCKWNKSCVYCSEHNAHHRSLCPKKFKGNLRNESAILSKEMEVIEEENNDGTHEEKAMVSAGEMVVMQTAKTEVKHPITNKNQDVRILLDCGSQRTYITKKLADKLELKGVNEEEIKLATFGSDKPSIIKTKTTTLCVKLNDGNYMTINANIVPVISGNIQRRHVDITSNSNFNHLVKSLDLADTIPTHNEFTSIEMLIGNDYYLDLILSQKIEIQPGMYLLGSKLGWILSGRTSECEPSNDVSSMLILTHGRNLTQSDVFQSVDNSLSTKPDLQDFWDIEAIGVKDDPLMCDDVKAMETFKNTLRFEQDRYQVTWPWKEEHPELPLNKELAYGRLKSCGNRLKNKPDVMKKYDSVIQYQINKGIVEKVDNSSNENITHYIPHHAVITPQKSTTKLRVVYDASAKTKAEYKSLNECLFRGPVLLHDLCGLLMRFRLHRIALVSDIEKAFLQIGLQPSQRDVTRFLWLKDIDNTSGLSNNIQEYRFCRVPFGVISSPFLLGATVESHLDTYNTDVAHKLKNDIYVDNIITGTHSEGEAIQLYKDAKRMFKDASMNLREWLSNSDLVNECIPVEDKADYNETNVLGHVWDFANDTISLKQPKDLNSENKISKRNVLKGIASVFDPLRLFSPIVLRGKLLLQEMWSKKLDWDDTVEDKKMQLVWCSLLSELEKLSEFTLPRCLAMNSPFKDAKFDLLCFCDASTTSYSAAVYLRQENKEQTKVDLMFAKTRLAPIKSMTIPRLELMAVLIGTRCLQFVTEQLNLPIQRRYLWTDSQCVLSWLISRKTLPVFVRNRVNEINKYSEITIAYVNTKDNPADVATRSITLEDLHKNTQWWHGPSWLLQPIDTWSNSHKINSTLQTNSDQEDITETNICDTFNANEARGASTNKQCSPFGIDIQSYSSVTKLLRVTVLAERFIKKIRKQKSECGTIKSNEIQDAENKWLLYIQRKNFADIFEGMTKNKPTNLQMQLGLYIDSSGILRSKGRLENAGLSEGARCPILLAKRDKFTQLLVQREHKLCLHSGVSQTLASMRQKYWIPGGRAVIRSIVSACIVCRKVEGGPYKMPNMPSLPTMRVNECTPFNHTGLDYLGPLYIKGSDGSKKVWICLFTCLVTRAVHLEIIDDMSAEEFILCFRRFVSQRGTPVQVISDNAKQFKLASSVIDRAWSKIVHSDDVQNYVSTAGVKYERLVGLVKRSLRKTIGRKLLTFIQLLTFVKEIEAVVNSRPLVYVGDDVNSTITLTPSVFLTLNPTMGIPQSTYDEDDSDYIPKESSSDKLLKIWKKGQNLLNSFWKMWREDYVMSLRERMQYSLKTGKTKSPFPVKIGDVVLIKDNLPRGCWRMGRINELMHSRDDKVRSAKVKLSSGKILGRPLNLLYPIECSNSDSDHDI